ncbi:MAG: transposase, partial [Candidatus Hydromicrobium sp.]
FYQFINLIITFCSYGILVTFRYGIYFTFEVSGRRLFMKYPGLKKKLYKGHLWNLQTYVETVGHISEDTIEKYIQDQKKK